MLTPSADVHDLGLQQLENAVFDLEIAIDAARADLLRCSDQLLMARRRLAKYRQESIEVESREVR